MTFKSLHLTNAWHPTSGGVATFYRALFDAANEHQQFVRLVAPAADNAIVDAGPYGRIYCIKGPRSMFDRAYHVIYPTSYLIPGGPVHRILQEELPDLVEICDKYTLLFLGGLLRVGLLPGVRFRPAVIGLSCERMDETFATYCFGGRAAEPFCRFYMGRIYFPMFDHHIAVSEHTAAELRPASKGHKIDRGVWIGHMGVETSRFTPARRSVECRRRLLRKVSAETASVLLLYAGRLAPEKNLDLLLQIMDRLAGVEPDYRLIVAGDGSLRKKLEGEAKRRLGDRVVFLGHVSDRDELADLYANCDVFLHPNPREPFGIAPLEAMASGLALVAPGSGGVTAYANESNAWLVEANAESFVAAIRNATADPGRRNAKTLAARQTAEDFDWRTATARFLRLYRELHALTTGLKPGTVLGPSFYSTA